MPPKGDGRDSNRGGEPPGGEPRPQETAVPRRKPPSGIAGHFQRKGLRLFPGLLWAAALVFGSVFLVWAIDAYLHLTGGFSVAIIALAFLCCLIAARRQFLQIGEARFHLIADSIPQLAWMADKDGWIFWYNQRWYEYTGTTQEQTKGWGWQSVHDPAVLPAVLERWNASIATGQPFEMEYPLRGADGHYRMFMTRVLPIKEQGSRTVLWVGTSTDIEEHRRVEESLRRLYDSGIMGVFYWTPEGAISDANDKFLDIMGYTRQDLQSGGLDWTRMTPEKYRAQDQQMLARLQNGSAVTPIEKHFLRKDGTLVPVEIGAAMAPTFPRNGVAFVLDITHRKEVEAKLEDLNQTLDQRVRIRTAELAEVNHKLSEIQANLHAVLNGATEISIIATDPQGVITVFNSGAERMLQYEAGEVIGTKTPALFHVESECLARSAALSKELGRPVEGFDIFAEPARLGQSAESEWSYVRKDGSILPVWLSITAVRDADGCITGFMEVASDLTPRKNLERELRDRNAQLERGVRERTEKLQSALAEKTVLLKEVNHRVKNNLAIVASLLGMQADAKQGDAQPGNDATAPLLESQRRVHAMALIHEHLYGKADLNRIRFDEYADKLATELCIAFSSPTRISVHVRAEPIEVSVDKAIPCGLILNELISNAFKHAFPDGRAGNICVTFAEKRNGCLMLTVSDDGVGIPEGSDWARTDSLGLKIVQILSKQLDANVCLGNPTGKDNGGTQFSMDFPIDEYAHCS